MSTPPSAPRPSRIAAPAPARASVSLESPLPSVDVASAADASPSLEPLPVGALPPFSPVATSTGTAASLSRVTEAGNSLSGGPIQRTVSPFA